MRDIQGKTFTVAAKESLIPIKESRDADARDTYRGRAFRPVGTDSVGRIVSVSPGSVVFTYDHAPSVKHSMHLSEFTTYFATWSGEGFAW